MAPRYLELLDKLTADIRSGEFPVGSFLPTEPTLAKSNGVSRSTLRAALARMQELGMVERRPGAGTLVLAKQPAARYVHNMVASGDLLQFAGPTERQIECVEQIVADEELSAELDVSPGRRWLHVGQKRLSEKDQRILCWTDVYIPEEHAHIRSQLKTWDGLFYELLEVECSVLIVEIRQVVTATGVPAGIADHLQKSENGHCLLLRRTYLSQSGQVEMVTRTYLPSPDNRYQISLRRTGA